MFIAIRDDDTSFWTKPEEVEKLYGCFFEKGGKVSLAVVPCSWRQVNPGIEREFYIDKDSGKRFVYENKKLVDYLLDKIKEGVVEIMQHGYDHVYGVSFDGNVEFLDEEIRRKLKKESVMYKYLPECVFKRGDVLAKDLKEGKEILEDTFKVKVRVFVPPGNALSREAVRVVSKLGMHISGIMGKTMNRPISVKTIINYVKRVYWKLKYNLPYPFVMDYGTHKELVAYAFTPTTDFNWFYNIFNLCQKIGAPFVLATHYWEVLREKGLYKKFLKFLSNISLQNLFFLDEILRGKNG